jgi:hypothetical protein
MKMENYHQQIETLRKSFVEDIGKFPADLSKYSLTVQFHKKQEHYAATSQKYDDRAESLIRSFNQQKKEKVNKLYEIKFPLTSSVMSEKKIIGESQQLQAATFLSSTKSTEHLRKVIDQAKQLGRIDFLSAVYDHLRYSGKLFIDLIEADLKLSGAYDLELEIKALETAIDYTYKLKNFFSTDIAKEPINSFDVWAKQYEALYQ